MCGFTGWFDLRPSGQNVLERMTEKIAHRGPDASGYYHGKGPVSFGHRRLSIIDLEASAQPMTSSDGRFVLVFNGELYNFKQLQCQLKDLGKVFTTEGDTEVLLQALIVWGKEALGRLQGMFAFAFWDAKEERLLLARDHLGVKPLHFSWNGQTLLFGSEIKSLTVHPDFSAEIDKEALELYLECQYIPTPYTIYKQIRKLPAGHFLELQKGRLEQKRYWHLSYLPKWDYNEETALEILDKELQRSVSSMLVSDVPLGAFLSGGLDSSLIASLMQRESPKKIKTFHICFPKPFQSEEEHARRAASYIGTEHHSIEMGADDFLAMLGSWGKTFDEPFGDQAAIPTLFLSKMTKKHVSVVLTGEGADEIFAGYPNYLKKCKEAPLAALLGKKFSPFPLLYRFLPPIARKNRVFKAAARPLSRRYTTIPNLFDRELHASILSPTLYSSNHLGLDQLAERHYISCDATDYLDKMLHIDTHLWLADDLLTKVDRATMAYSIEARVPYLDHHLVAFASRLPTHLKLNEKKGKYLLKRLAEKHLPLEIVHRSKMGFSLPLREWLAGKAKPLLDDAMRSLEHRNLFRSGFIQRLCREETARKRQHAGRLFSLLSLELWLQQHNIKEY